MSKLIVSCTTKTIQIPVLMSFETLEAECNKLNIKPDLEIPVKKKTNKYRNCGVYEVESIYNWAADKKSFEVKWKNYSLSDNTWEPIEHLGGCSEVLQEFKYIEKSSNPQLFRQKYRNYHRLKSIIENLNCKQMEEGTLESLVVIISGESINDFCYTQKRFKEIRREIREFSTKTFNDVSSKQAKVSVRVNAMMNQYEKLINKLNILKRFETVEQFFDYIEGCNVVQRKIKLWEKKINNINKETSSKLIRVQNYVDLEQPPEDFVYITKCKPFNDEIKICDDDPPVFCNCKNCFDCKDDCCPKDNNSEFAYTQKKLITKFQRTAIYECNKKCQCGPDCINRVVQKGIQVNSIAKNSTLIKFY